MASSGYRAQVWYESCIGRSLRAPDDSQSSIQPSRKQGPDSRDSCVYCGHSGGYPRTIALSSLALEYLPKEHMARAYVSWYLGRAYWLSGDLQAASMALAQAAHVSWKVNHLYSVFLVTYDLAQVQQLQGHLHPADQTYRQALQQARERGAD